MSIPPHLLRSDLSALRFGPLRMDKTVNGWVCGLEGEGWARAAIWVPRAHRPTLDGQFRTYARGNAHAHEAGGLVYLYISAVGDEVTAALLLDEYTKKLEELGYRPT